MTQRKQLIPGAVLLVLGSVPLLAQVSIPNIFSAGTPAVASEVNANFAALKDAVETLQAKVASQDAEIESLKGNSALTLDGYVELVADDNYPNEKRVLFSGVNVQVINGLDQATVNGLGNLIVGYDEPRSATGALVCSNGEYKTKQECTDNSEVWASSHKSGSHNLVVGNNNAYSQTGGFVAGFDNAVTRSYATVSGGQLNIASGPYSSVSGGRANIVSASSSVISGGVLNTVSGDNSSVSGGYLNSVSGQYGSVSGGSGNSVSGLFGSVSGGSTNSASASVSSISGGRNNTASGPGSSISGGFNNSASGDDSSILGGLEGTAGTTNETIPSLP